MEDKIEEQNITFETAKLAKEKGFEFNVNFGVYDMSGKYHPYMAHWISGVIYPAPSQSLLQKWLRDNHKINIVIIPSFKCYNINYITQYNEIEDDNIIFELEGLDFKDFDSYEDALEEGLFIGLKQIK